MSTMWKKVEVNNEAEAAICEYCGTPFIVEKAINNYNVTNNISVVGVNVADEKDFVIRGGVLEQYNGESIDVIIPDNVVTIGEKVFCGMTIRNIFIPNSVKIIDYDAFKNCTRLTQIHCSKWFNAFKITPWWKNIQAKRRPQGLCQHCGGTYKGLFTKACSKCGKLKDY